MLARWFPLLRDLRQYQKAWLSRDLMAGLSVAAVQIPTAMAYANLAGFPPETGLYASMLPVLAYALLGSSRQLVVGPDAATCAMIAALLIPIANGDPIYYLKLSAALAITAGLLMVIGGMTRMGFIVNFFGRPILVGFLNGIALSIMVGQMGKLLDIGLENRDFGPSLLELVRRAGETHLPSLAVGVATLLLLIVISRRAPRAPVALVGLVTAGLGVYLLGLGNNSVMLVGTVPSGLPQFALPGLGYSGVQSIFMNAVGLVIVSFTSTMLTARSFATRNGYALDADQEMRAVGFANIAAGFFGGFAIAGADSRTAVNDASGGKTQLVSVVAALATAVVALFLAKPLGQLPLPALGAVLIFSAWGLLDIAAWKELFGISRFEFGLSLLTTVGVLTIGVLPGVVLAILLAILYVLKRIYQPREAILGLAPGLDGYNDLELSPDSKTIPGIVIYRFEGPLLFFNADLFKARILELVANASPPAHSFVLSLEAVTQMDVTGLQALFQVHDVLKAQGVRLLLARPKRYMRKYAQTARAVEILGKDNIFPSIRSAVKSALAKAAAEPPLGPGFQPTT